jgi:hypothetical protein
MNAKHPAQSWAVVLLLTLLMTLFCATLPSRAATAELDPSWQAFLQYAAAHRLKSGSEVVFTYGPLGHLVATVYAGGPVYPRLFFEFIFVSLNVLPLAFLTRNSSWRLRTAIYGLITLGPILIVTGKDGLVQLGMVWWGWLCFINPVGTVGLPALALAILAAISGLIKFSWLVIGAGTCAAVLADLVVRRAWWPAAMLLIAAITTFGGLWWIQGQQLSEIGNYLTASASVASGYAETMGLRCSGGTLALGIGLLTCAILAIFLPQPEEARDDGRPRGVRRVLMSLWLSTLLFISWKHGFTRADAHVVIFGMFAGMLCLVPLALQSTDNRFSTMRGWLAVIALVLAMALSQKNFPGSILQSPRIAICNFGYNLGSLVRPIDYADSLAESWRTSCCALSLPGAREALGNDSMDVYGWRQTYAIANGFNYTPRPVCQSYSSYNRDLISRNTEFYRSGHAPEWVLFDLAPIDGRMPSLEDSLCLVEILRRYQFVEDVDPFLLLKKTARPSGGFSLLETGTSNVGRLVDLRAHSNKDIWVEVDVAAGLVAKLQATLLRPAILRIRLHTAPVGDGSGKHVDQVYNAPLAMLSAGFLINPLLRSNEDVKQVLLGNGETRIHGFTLEPAQRISSLKDEEYTYRLYEVVPRISRRQASDDRF